MDMSRAEWRKSTRSTNGGNCVEIASVNHVIAVRDSKNPDGHRLIFPDGTWRTFVGSLKSGRYDL